MKFEYKLLRQGESNSEVNQYCIYSAHLGTVFNGCIVLPFYITISILVFTIAYVGFNNFFEFASSLEMIIVMAVIFLVSRAVIKHTRKKSKRIPKSKVKTKNKKIDTDSIFKVTIEEDIFTRESEFSFLQFPMDKVKYIDLLKSELVINFGGIHIFIPKDSLPLSINEFIEIFKDKNSLLEVHDYSEKIKKRRVIYKTIYVLIIVIGIIIAYFTANYMII